MYYRSMIFLVGLIGLTVYVQMVNAGISGQVSNNAGSPIANAILTLVGQGLKDTTGADGSYALTTTGVAELPLVRPQSTDISLNRGFLDFSLLDAAPVKVEIFDVNGNLLKKEVRKNVQAGLYRFNILENSRTANLLVIHASIGQHTTTFRYLPLNNGTYSVNSFVEGSFPMGGKLTKITAHNDTLKVTAANYTAKALAITSYDTTINITLDTAGGTVSEGCGKTPPASGVKTSMDVDGTKREYLLKLPANYDPGKQYKLIFCPHWMGGKIEDVVSGAMCGGPYYGLEKLANGTAIFVLPQGLSSGGSTGFPNTNGQDIKFFKALLKYCNSTMCIDQKHIFSLGFSYGGMMSLAAGCAMPDVFRAIAPMSGAFYSGCDSTSKGPVAMWQAHGTSDNVVPIANAKTALKYYLARNGCSDQTKPVDPSPCVQYQGCKEGYPVIFCEFSGGHGVQSFAAAAIWAFFSQF